MTDVTVLLEDLIRGDRQASAALFSAVHTELRKIAEGLMLRERVDHTLQATALIHEAYVRLVDVPDPQLWDGRAHFLSAAAESMRRILVDHARGKLAQKRGGAYQRHSLAQVDGDALASLGPDPALIIDVSDALEVLSKTDPQAAELVRLRFFAGLTIADAAKVAGIASNAAYGHWSYAKARLAKLLDSTAGG